MGIRELHRQFVEKRVSVSEVVRGYIDRIRKSRLNAYITVFEEEALECAKRIDDKIARGDKVGILEGIPVAVKDNICVKGYPTTCGSKILERFVPPYDATVVERLKQQGVIMLGKTNMDEFAMGSSNEYSYFGPTLNPIDEERVPGGSSGGSAAAVGAGEALVALGSDTGGSIRLPAAYCGVVGLKPTYGRVSRYGLVAFASSLDQIGPIAGEVEDVAILLQVIAGFDERDSTSLDAEVPNYLEEMQGEVSGWRIGLPKEYWGEGIDDAIKATVRDAVREWEKLGVRVKEISLPHTKYAIPTYYLIATAEASSNLARYDGIRYGLSCDGGTTQEVHVNTRTEGFGDEVKRRIMLGTFALKAGYKEEYYLKATQVRELIRGDFMKAFEEVDLMVTPTAPVLPFKLGERVKDPLAMYIVDVLTVGVNLAGLPAISIPYGEVDGLPVGVQIIGPFLGESKILRLAYALERVTR